MSALVIWCVLGAASACSLATDWDRFEGDEVTTMTDAGDAAPTVADSAPPAVNPDCNVADDRRLLCADFNDGGVVAAWKQAITAQAGDSVTLEKGLVHSTGGAARFRVAAGQTRYAELMQNLSTDGRVDVIAYLHIDASTIDAIGDVTIFSLGVAVNADEVKVVIGKGGATLVYMNAGAADTTPIEGAKVPTKQYTELHVVRDGRAVTVEIGGGKLVRHVLPGAGTPTTTMQLRVGIVLAQNAAVSLLFDDVLVSKLP